MDLRLPDAPGTDVLSALRQQPGVASVPVVAVEFRPTEHERTRLHILGLDEVLDKPLNAGDVRRTVLHALLAKLVG